MDGLLRGWGLLHCTAGFICFLNFKTDPHRIKDQRSLQLMCCSSCSSCHVGKVNSFRKDDKSNPTLQTQCSQQRNAAVVWTTPTQTILDTDVCLSCALRACLTPSSDRPEWHFCALDYTQTQPPFRQRVPLCFPESVCRKFMAVDLGRGPRL